MQKHVANNSPCIDCGTSNPINHAQYECIEQRIYGEREIKRGEGVKEKREIGERGLVEIEEKERVEGWVKREERKFCI